MTDRPHIASLFAIAVILASGVNLAVMYAVTSRPRAIIHNALTESAATSAPVAVEHPRISIEDAVAKNDVQAVKQHMASCKKDGSCDLDKDLRIAATASNPAIARLLIAAGAKVNATDNARETPLHTAATRGRMNVAQVLLAAGADVNARDEYGLTPLHSAAAWGHVELARVLLSAGANANATDARQQTPLHLVASRRVPPLSGYAAVARVLLDAGARPNARATDGSTPLHLAKMSASELALDGNVKAVGDANEVVNVLREHGARE
ncbi:MAG TPA: ankyrin repeat domain-containing protein [Candidatus Limnocylindrales bacterium]|nr:ankyrin repeat domain-containing protein [Candidatus Limnocylindrales bacterium]